MDFIVGFPQTWRQNGSIWVIVDRLKISAQFIPVKSTYTTEDYARIYNDEIVILHGIPLSIMLGRGAQFNSRLWRSFKRGLATQVKLSIAFHPQMDDSSGPYYSNPRRYIKSLCVRFR